MKAIFSTLTFLSTFAFATIAHAECSRPPQPAVPDGASASEQEMVEAQQKVKTFIEETNSFMECLDQEEAKAVAAAEESGEPLSGEDRNAFVTRHNAAVDAMHKVADDFNVELRTYMDRNSD